MGNFDKIVKKLSEKNGIEGLELIKMETRRLFIFDSLTGITPEIDGLSGCPFRFGNPLLYPSGLQGQVPVNLQFS